MGGGSTGVSIFMKKHMIYADADYMCLERSQLENDNATVPDSLDDIKPRFHKEDKRNLDGDDEGSGRGRSKT